jgi:integrase
MQKANAEDIKRGKMLAEGEIEDPNFDRRLDIAVAGCQPFVKRNLLSSNIITRENAKIIVDYIIAFQTEVSPRLSYRRETILRLTELARFHHPKPFKEMTRQDIIDFLNRLRKPEPLDPLHKWIGTYENNRVILLRFFRWLHCSDPINTPPAQRPKPAVMQNIPSIRRLEKSIYKPTDIWTHEDDMLFCQYCPSKRDRAYFMVSRDTGCRPSELTNIRIKDLVVMQMDDRSHIVKVTVNGKTGTRTVRIYYAYPYVKDWLSNGHPFPSVPDVPLFCSTGKKNVGRKISAQTIHKIFSIYKRKFFPKLLADPTISEGDKRKIRDLLQKPWNPHFRRHTSATEISKRLKDPVLINEYMGWSQRGNTRQRYQHYYANDSVEAMLVADGLMSPTSKTNKKDLLKPKQCPNCDEANKSDAKFCVKCGFVMSFDAFNEVSSQLMKKKKS